MHTLSNAFNGSDLAQAGLPPLEELMVACTPQLDSEACFRQALANMAHRLFDDNEVAEEAIREAAFSVNGHTVVLSFDEENDSVDFYCDLGLPPNSTEAENVFRKLLQYDLADPYHGILFGLHPASGRIVAYTRVGSIFIDEDGDFCLDVLHGLVAAAQEVRDW